jgi:hypothetical protein
MIKPPLASPGDALGPPRRHPHPSPVHDHDDNRGPHTTGGELGIDHIGQGARHEPQQRRVVEDGHRELAPHRQKPHRLRDPARHPVVHAPLIARRQLCRHQRGRQQKNDGRHKVQKDAGQTVNSHRRRRPQTRHRRRRHQRQSHPRDVIHRLPTSHSLLSRPVGSPLRRNVHRRHDTHPHQDRYLLDLTRALGRPSSTTGCDVGHGVDLIDLSISTVSQPSTPRVWSRRDCARITRFGVGLRPSEVTRNPWIKLTLRPQLRDIPGSTEKHMPGRSGRSSRPTMNGPSAGGCPACHSPGQWVTAGY